MQGQTAVAPTAPNATIVDEHGCAAILGVSVGWLRADRLGRRIVPYYKLGGLVRYNMRRVEQALAAVEFGGGQASNHQRRAA